jgi:hypothetical protein
MRTPNIELLWWEGCPSSERAHAELSAVLQDLGLGDVPVRSREIRTDDDADAEGFRGSPTILIDGLDVVPTDDPIGLSCRVYRRHDGRISPTPDPEDVRAALRRAANLEVAR